MFILPSVKNIINEVVSNRTTYFTISEAATEFVPQWRQKLKSFNRPMLSQTSSIFCCLRKAEAGSHEVFRRFSAYTHSPKLERDLRSLIFFTIPEYYFDAWAANPAFFCFGFHCYNSGDWLPSLFAFRFLLSLDEISSFLAGSLWAKEGGIL
jgi:hypothetical protein